jgi:hypothetical protein
MHKAKPDAQPEDNPSRLLLPKSVVTLPKRSSFRAKPRNLLFAGSATTRVPHISTLRCGIQPNQALKNPAEI